MARIEIVPATLEHGAYVAERMREADRVELAAIGLTPQQAAHESLRASGVAWTGLVDQEPVCIFGAAGPTLLSTAGWPWLLSTDGIVAHQKAFLRRNRRYVGEMLRQFSTLMNFVDARNAVSIRWLKWLGFTLDDPQPFGLSGEPFHPFKMEAA